MKSILGATIFLCISIRIIAQTEDPVINSNVNTWNKYSSRRSPDLFLQLDKSVYTSNENILFTAYLLDQGFDTTAQDVLHVILVDLAEKKVVASDRFFMHEGISSGSLLVPDSVDNGDYLIMAYTNIMQDGSEGYTFRQPIRIGSGKRSPFSLTVAYGSPGSAGSKGHNGFVALDSIRLTCRIMTDYMGLASGAAFNYSLYADGLLVQSGKRTIDPFGEAHISLPIKDTLAQSMVLYSMVNRQGVTAHLRTPLAVRPGKIDVNYYPEGGFLVDGHPTRMGITISAGNGMGISTSGILMEDGKDLCDFRTDAYGIAAVTCTVHKERKYQLRLADLPAGSYICGQFPAISAEGFSFHIMNGVCRDSLTIDIRGPKPDSKGIIMIYNEHSLLYTARIGLPSGAGKLSLPVKGWPRGIAEVTLYNEDGGPVAERDIFLPAAKINVSIQTDSLIYHTRSKVKLHIRVTDEQNRGMAGLFSLTSVQAARVNTGNYQDIVKHADFDRYLPAGHGSMPPLNYFDNDTSIDLVLLTRFWTKDRWLSIKEDTAIKAPSSGRAEDYGYVLHDGRKVRRPVPLFLMGSSVYSSFSTDSLGHFQIPARALIMPFGANPILAVMDKKDQADYNIIVQNRYDSVNDALARAWYVPQQLMNDTAIKDEEEAKEGFNTAKTLKTVVVKGRSEELRHYPGSCSDQVCMYGILNCPNHPGCCRSPRNGEEVIVPGFGPMIYTGNCADNASFLGAVRGIHLVREYYNKDSASFSPSEPALLPTLYWAPVVVTDGNGEATINFYTDDLTGRFMNIIQGVAGEAVFSGKQSFTVGR